MLMRDLRWPVVGQWFFCPSPSEGLESAGDLKNEAGTNEVFAIK
jgi:hypothetical protein